MPDDRLFESLLHMEFKWPKVGESPFSVSADPERNAYIDRHGHGRLVGMIMGYKLAADTLVEKATTAHDRDILVFPILFNYRHFIELSLKYLIAMYGPAVEIEADWRSHNIAALWRKVVQIFNAYGVGDEQSDKAVEQVIADFAKIDPRSFSYRYPVDTYGQIIDLGQEQLDLSALATIMEGLDRYFDGSDGYLDHLKGAAPNDC